MQSLTQPSLVDGRDETAVVDGSVERPRVHPSAGTVRREGGVKRDVARRSRSKSHPAVAGRHETAVADGGVERCRILMHPLAGRRHWAFVSRNRRGGVKRDEGV